MRRLAFLIAALIAATVLASCAPPPQLRNDQYLKDTSLLSDEPCAAPCWRGITPGETRWRDALTLIEDDRQLASVETNQPDPNLPAILADFNDAEGGVRCCRMFSNDGEIVSSVLTLLAPQMTLGEVLEKYGDPQYYVGEGVTDDQALVSVLYPEIPLIVYVFSQGTANGDLSATSEIIGAIYLTADDMSIIMSQNNLYAWSGYGKLSDLLDGAFDSTPVPTDETSDEPAEATPEGAEATPAN